MKTRMFLVAAALLLFAGLSFGQQPFSAVLYNIEYVLRDVCDVGNPLPDGTPVEIRWDNDSNGPDADDPQPTVCNNPPNCADGPAGTVNYNMFLLNGEAQFLGAGYFATDVAFSSVGILPNPARYYLVIRCSNGAVHYQSDVFVLTSGGQEVFVHNYSCFPCVQACTPNPPVVSFTRHPVPASVCAEVCPTIPTLVTVCPDPGTGPLDPTKLPILTVAPGCLVPGRCENPCPPASAALQPLGYNPATGCFEFLLVSQNEGCVCITLEGFLAASIESFTGVAGDGEVSLSWITSSEVNISSYQVVRNGEVIANVASENSPVSHTYVYTDETAENGTSYTYALRVVNSDNSITETAFEVNATPSFGAAVVTEYALHQNFPNPFNPSTSLTFDVVEKNFVTLKVYNAAGQEVATVANGEFDSGRHIVSFDAGNMPSGLYFYTVKIGNEFTATKKMLLVK